MESVNFTKCGELYLDHDKKHFMYLCSVCNETFTKLQSFESHVYEHFDDVDFKHQPHDVDDETETVMDYEVKSIVKEEDIDENTTAADDETQAVNHHEIVVSDNNDNDTPRPATIRKSSKSQLKCTCCRKTRTFPCFGLLSQHVAGVVAGSHRCPIPGSHCLAKFSTVTEATEHGALHSQPDLYMRQNCGKAFNVDIELKLHCGQRAGSLATFVEEKFKDSRPDATIDPIVRRKTPIRVNTNDECAFVCDVCEKIFSHYSEIKQHMKQFHGCPARLNKKQTEDTFNDLLNEEATTPNWVKCGQCDERFQSQEQLVQHLDVHQTERTRTEGRFDCAYCKSSFRMRENLLQHERIHRGERPFECTLCDKRFNHSSYINIHMRTHTGEKPYCCDECDAAFISKSKLTGHVKRAHQKLRPHVCSVCGEAFGTPSILRDHFRSCHTLERPFSCNVCGKSFAKTKLLRQHAQLHADQKQFECRFCPLKFAQFSGRRGHERRVHPDENLPGTTK